MSPHAKSAIALTSLATAALLVHMALPTPVVRASLGSRLGDVRDASTVAFDFDGMEDMLPYVIDTPVVFEYAAVGPGTEASEALGFALPEARLVWLSQNAGVVYSIAVTPQTEPLGLEAAFALCETVAAAIAQAPGWARTSDPSLRLGVLRDYYAGDPVASEARFATWHAGKADLSVSLRRTEEGGRDYPPGYPERLKATEDEFAVTVTAFSAELADLGGHAALERRREVNGSIDEPLPIQVWLDDPLRP